MSSNRIDFTLQASWSKVLNALNESCDAQEIELSELRAFLSDPPHWSSAHGGIAG
jgi:hypothetical protein